VFYQPVAEAANKYGKPQLYLFVPWARLKEIQEQQAKKDQYAAKNNGEDKSSEHRSAPPAIR